MQLDRRFTACLLGMALLASCGPTQPGSSANFDQGIRPDAIVEASGVGNSGFAIERLTGGLEHPWGMTFLPDGRLLVTERQGRLRLVDADFTLQPEPLAGVPTAFARGQGGLLDVELHPDFAGNRLVYLSYAYLADDGAGTAVARGRLAEGALADVEVIFESNGLGSGGRHFGSRLLFDRDGYLFITHGDRGERQLAQQLDNHAGSVLRLHADGRVPADNPFVGRDDARPEIFSYGHRNPQGMALHPETGAVWVHEHGPRGGDEVNIIEAGGNFGWPVVSDGREYATGLPIGADAPPSGMIAPIHVWDPSIAPSGMAFYTGDAFPEWRGDVLLGALAFQLLARLELDGDAVVGEERLLEGELGRIRDVVVGPDGLVYLLTDAADGGIYRLRPAASAS
jgi:glucose/arabinose dehydrogenase